MHSWRCGPLIRRQPIDIYLNTLAIRDAFKIQIKSTIFSNTIIMGKNVVRLLLIFIISLPAISLVSGSKNSSLTTSMPKNT